MSCPNYAECHEVGCIGECNRDDGPSVEELAHAVTVGSQCCECSVSFRKAHGHKVACAFCFARLTEAEVKAMGVRLAFYSEMNRLAHRTEAQKRKNARKS